MHQPVTRRGLFAGSLGLIAARAHAARVSKMKFGLTSYQWGADWDIPTMIANCTRAKAYGVELRTSAHYAHGVEPEIGADRRREAREAVGLEPRLHRRRERLRGHAAAWSPLRVRTPDGLLPVRQRQRCGAARAR